MDKTNRVLMRMLLDGHYRSDRMKRKIIKLFTRKTVEPVPLEAFKKYLLEFYKLFRSIQFLPVSAKYPNS